MIKIGIVGYGNLGRAIESAASVCDDITVNAIFSRRALSLRAGNIPIYGYGDIEAFDKALDCLVLASGSSGDLPVITPAVASKFNTVDSFDDHFRIKEHYEAVDTAAKKRRKNIYRFCRVGSGIVVLDKTVFFCIYARSGSKYVLG